MPQSPLTPSTTASSPARVQERPTGSRYIELIIIMGALQGFAPMSVDMYLASLPTLEDFFSASTAEVQRTLAAFFVGFASGQLIYGPLTDRFGRKAPLYGSLTLFVAASVGCSLAPSIGWMAFFRLLQAVGACGGSVISRAMVRDLFPPAETRRVFSMLMLVNGVAPITAPLLGGYLLVWFGWQSVFWTLAGIGVLGLAGVAFRLPETFDLSKAQPIRPGFILSTYGSLLRDRVLLGACLAVGIGGAGMFAYIASAPFVFIELYGVPEQRFGWIFASIALGIIFTSQINARLLGGVSAQKVLKVASLIQMIGGLLLLINVLTDTGGMLGVWIPLLMYVSCIGLIFPSGAALALAEYPQVAGMASALLGTFQFGVAAISTSVLGFVGEGSALPMAFVVLACGIGGVLVNLLILGRAPAPADAV